MPFMHQAVSMRGGFFCPRPGYAQFDGWIILLSQNPYGVIPEPVAFGAKPAASNQLNPGWTDALISVIARLIVPGSKLNPKLIVIL